MKNNKKKGFTLVELVVVIAVIAILAGVLIGTFTSVISRANQSKALQELRAELTEVEVAFAMGGVAMPEEAVFEKDEYLFQMKDGSLTALSKVTDGPTDWATTFKPTKLMDGTVMWAKSAFVHKDDINTNIDFYSPQSSYAWNARSYAPDDFAIATQSASNVKGYSLAIYGENVKAIYSESGSCDISPSTGVAFQAEKVFTLNKGQYYTYSITYSFEGTAPITYTGIICLDAVLTTTAD